MSLCSELENIDISMNYFSLIKDMFSDYTQYIINYKAITNEYIKKLSLLQEQIGNKLFKNEKDISKRKINHIYSLTLPIRKIIDSQIENWSIFLDGIELQIENNNKVIKEREIISNKLQLMLEDARKDLLKKYQEIDKLKDIFILNMENTEDIINKYLTQIDNNIITKDQMKSIISNTKKIEEEYLKLINSTKLYEDNFDSQYTSALENLRKLASETSNQMKDSIIDFIVLLKNNIKIQLSEIDTYIPELNDLDEVKKIDNIILKSYKKDNKLIHVKPVKYKLKVFRNENVIGGKDNNNKLINQIFYLEDGFGEMMLINDKNIIKTIRIMKENFETFEDDNLNIECEEEKLKCVELTKKIVDFEDKKMFNNVPMMEEIGLLINLLDKHHNRVVFLQQITLYRSKGEFEISLQTFDILSKLFNIIINKAQDDSDFHSIENIIILSHTYYIKGEKKDDKIYLQKRIKNNDIFKSKNFWEEFLDFSINKAIVKNVNNDIESGNISIGNRKETGDKMKNIVFSQIVPYVHNMKAFEIDKEIIKEIVILKMEKYKMSNELIESVKGVIYND